MIIRIKDFEDENGKIDWKAYHEAELENGERCTKCGGYILFGKGHRETCLSCKELSTKAEEVMHKHFIRCPKCDHLENVHDDHYGLFQEGEHDVFCPQCDHQYTISTHVQFDFTSPPKVPEEEEVEEDDDETVDAKTEGGT